MSTYVYVLLEVYQNNHWIHVGDFVHDEEYDFALVPINIAPDSWGKFNFAVYYEASKEKDLPPDLSTPLKIFINTHWPTPNRPSWMTVAEMRAFYDRDYNGRFAHFDFEKLANQFDLPEAHIRIIFWADQ
jgi:hypothetical protein